MMEESTLTNQRKTDQTIMPLRYQDSHHINNKALVEPVISSQKKVAQSSLSKVNGGLAGAGIKVIQGNNMQKFTSSNQVTEEFVYGESKAAGPESSLLSDHSKTNLVLASPQ